MEDFEQKLKTLAPREPSPALDGRVLAALAHTAPSPVQPVRRFAILRWAVAAAMLMGVLLGFLAGRLSAPGGGPVQSAQGDGKTGPSVTVHVVYEGHGGNPFDFTTAADDGLRPVSDIKITSTPGA
jgi:hypothetical protein